MGINELGGLQQGLTGIALIAAGTLASAVGTLSLNEAVGQEAAALGTVELLDLAFGDVSMLINLAEDRLYDLGLLLGAGASEVIEGNVKPFIDITVYGMIMIAKLPRSNTLFQSPGLTGSAVFVGTADVKRPISPETAETGKDIGEKDLCQISEMRDVVHIRKCGSDESFFHKSTLLKNSYQNKVLPSFMQGNDQTFWFSALPRVTLWNTFTVYL